MAREKSRARAAAVARSRPAGQAPKHRKRTPEAKPEQLDRPIVVRSHGQAECAFCGRTFERTRAWAKYCSPYCRTTDFHYRRRAVGPKPQIISVDGHKLAQPRDVVDEALHERAERETAGTVTHRK